LLTFVCLYSDEYKSFIRLTLACVINVLIHTKLKRSYFSCFIALYFEPAFVLPDSRPSFLSCGNCGMFATGYSCENMMLITHLYLVQRLQMLGDLHQLPVHFRWTLFRSRGKSTSLYVFPSLSLSALTHGLVDWKILQITYRLNAKR